MTRAVICGDGGWQIGMGMGDEDVDGGEEEKRGMGMGMEVKMEDGRMADEDGG